MRSRDLSPRIFHLPKLHLHFARNTAYKMSSGKKNRVDGMSLRPSDFQSRRLKEQIKDLHLSVCPTSQQNCCVFAIFVCITILNNAFWVQNFNFCNDFFGKISRDIFFCISPLTVSKIWLQLTFSTKEHHNIFPVTIHVSGFMPTYKC